MPFLSQPGLLDISLPAMSGTAVVSSDGTVEAVLDNESHDFLFFVADGTGGHDFSRTVAEHNAKAARWSQYLQEQTRIRRQREAAEARAVTAGAWAAPPRVRKPSPSARLAAQSSAH